jgi:hypothetical protein
MPGEKGDLTKSGDPRKEVAAIPIQQEVKRSIPTTPAYHYEQEISIMTCRLIKTSVRTKWGIFYGFKSAPAAPRLDVRRLIDQGSMKVCPSNCWFSRMLRAFRRFGMLVAP